MQTPQPERNKFHRNEMLCFFSVQVKHKLIEKKSPIIIFTYENTKEKYFHSRQNMLIDRTSKIKKKKYLLMMMKHKIHFHFYHCYIIKPATYMSGT